MTSTRIFLLTSLTALFGCSLLFTACKKDNQVPASEITSINDLVVDPNFTFQTTNDVGIKVIMLDNNNGPVSGMRVDIYTAIPDSGGKRIISGITDVQGVFQCDYKIAAGVKNLAVGTNAIGFVKMQTVAVNNGLLQCTLGGKQIQSSLKSSDEYFFKSTNSIFKPLGAYNSQGIPKYLEPKNDIIDAATLKDIRNTLPKQTNRIWC